jgi:hypothetical protein
MTERFALGDCHAGYKMFDFSVSYRPRDSHLDTESLTND